MGSIWGWRRERGMVVLELWLCWNRVIGASPTQSACIHMM